MDTEDGFIVGVYNYCDRWCERCPLTGRCRVFAEEQRLSFETQMSTSAGAAPGLRSLGAVAAALEETIPDEHEPPRDWLPSRFCWPELSPPETELHTRASELGRRLREWLVPEACAQDAEVRDAAEVLLHFGFYLGPKVYRALRGRADCEEDGMLSDALGSAKAALVALDRLGDAWLRLAERGAISVLEAEPVVSQLQALTVEIETMFPRARSFVRPGFDEPEALAMLEWRERG
jgi:hypothetical protein